MITMQNWRVHVPPGDGMLGYETETGVARLAIQLDGEYPDWQFKLDTRREYQELNAFDFVHDGEMIYFDIVDELGLEAGRYQCQVRGECGDKRKLSSPFSLCVAEAVGAIEVLENMPAAELYQLEQRLTALKTDSETAAARAVNAAVHPPKLSESQTWLVWDPETNQYDDTGIAAEGEPGTAGLGVPVPTTASDAGKVPAVNAAGNGYELAKMESLPEVTTSDNGRLLNVNDGAWRKSEFCHPHFGFNLGTLDVTLSDWAMETYDLSEELVDGNTYRITLNGIEHELVCFIADGFCVLGDTPDKLGSQSGYGFMISAYGLTCGIIVADGTYHIASNDICIKSVSRIHRWLIYPTATIYDIVHDSKIFHSYRKQGGMEVVSYLCEDAERLNDIFNENEFYLLGAVAYPGFTHCIKATEYGFYAEAFKFIAEGSGVRIALSEFIFAKSEDEIARIASEYGLVLI